MKFQICKINPKTGHTLKIGNIRAAFARYEAPNIDTAIELLPEKIKNVHPSIKYLNRYKACAVFGQTGKPGHYDLKKNPPAPVEFCGAEIRGPGYMYRLRLIKEDIQEILF